MIHRLVILIVGVALACTWFTVGATPLPFAASLHASPAGGVVTVDLVVDAERLCIARVAPSFAFYPCYDVTGYTGRVQITAAFAGLEAGDQVLISQHPAEGPALAQTLIIVTADTVVYVPYLEVSP